MGYQEENGLAMKRLNETDQLESRLQSLGGSIRKQYLLEGFLRLAGFVLFGLVFLYILDYITHMPFVVRLCILIGGLIAGGVWFRKNFFKKYQKELSVEEVGLLVEKSNPNLQSRMISTLQFQASNEIKPGTSENLVEGMVNQTFQMIRDVQWTNAIDKKWVKKTMQMLVIGGVLFLLVGGISHNSFLVFFERLVNSSARYPTKTRILKVLPFEKEAGEKTIRIPEGEKILLTVTVDENGEVPPLGKVSIKGDSGSEAAYDLKFDEAKKVFTAELEPILENIQISIYLGDADWGPKSVLVIPRPKIISLNATVTPPKYTGLEVIKEQTGNLQVFEGSVIDFSIKSDKDLTSFQLLDFAKPEAKIAFTSKDGFTWIGQLKPTGNTKYTFQLVDKGKLESRDIPVYTISVANDKAPAIKIIKPLLSLEAAPVTKILVKTQLLDDFLVVGMRIKAQIMERDPNGAEIAKGEPKILFEDLKLNRKLVDYAGVWDLSKVGVVPGNQVKIWIEAIDNHEPAPLIMKSQEITVSIITVEELQLRLMGRMETIGKDVGNVIDEMKGSKTEIEGLNK